MNISSVLTTPTTQNMPNTAALDYKMADDSAANQETANALIVLYQPELSISKALRAGQSEIVKQGETVQYSLIVSNTGDAPAYNLKVRDILPEEMRETTPVTQQALLNGGAVTLDPLVYSTSTGEILWSLTDAQALSPGQDLVIDYNAQVDATIDPGLSLNNLAKIDAYYSKESADTAQRRQYQSTLSVSATVFTSGIFFRPDHQLTTQPGTTVIYPHTLDVVAGSQTGTLNFSVNSSQGMIWTIYQDTNDTGVLDSGDLTWVNGSSIGTDSKLFFIKGYVPTQAPDTWQDTTLLTAQLTVGGDTYEQTVKDITRVFESGAGSMTAEKEAAIDNDCDKDLNDETVTNKTFEIRKDIQPGKCAVFRIRFTNQGTGNLTNIEVHDDTPEYTTYIGDSATFETTPSGLTPGSITVPLDGGSGRIIWPYTGSLIPGAEGIVTYEVKVDE